MASNSVGEMAQFLQAYGVVVDGSGCRIHLLMLLRDLLEEQATALQLHPGTCLSCLAQQRVSLPKKKSKNRPKN